MKTLKRIFKQLFCKHKWDFKGVTGNYMYFHCPHCDAFEDRELPIWEQEP